MWILKKKRKEKCELLSLFIVNCRTWTILKGVFSARRRTELWEEVCAAAGFHFVRLDFSFSDLSRAHVSIPHHRVQSDESTHDLGLKNVF